MLKENLGRAVKFERKSSAIDLVTEFDHRAEEFIIETIRDHYPAHGILTEERPPQQTSATHKWIIDPLDGTINYSKGYPLFGVSIALEVDGKVMLGVVYIPMLEEWFIAERGQGVTRNGKPIRVSETDQLIDSLLATGFPYKMEGLRRNLAYFASFAQRARGIRRDGVAALDLCYVAMGRFDGFWEPALNPWDVAAGALIIEEAGGTLTGFDGEPLSIYGDTIVASNGKIHEVMIEVIRSTPSPQRSEGS